MQKEEQQVKRTRVSGEERRELILQAARRVFARTTYKEASTSELARESEITEPMLYKHFGSKKGLFLAVLDRFAPEFLVNLEKRIESRAQISTLFALEHIIDDYCSAITADPETQRILFQAVTESSDPAIAQCVNGHNRLVYERIRHLIERAQQENSLDPTIGSEAATWGFVSVLLTLQYGLMLNFSTTIVQHQQEISRIWLRGMHTST